MIEYIKGELTDLSPATAIVEAGGIGYELNISLVTYTAIQGKKEVKLYVHEQLVTGGRDDSFTLYGFLNKEERKLYRLLLSVNGVGANTARLILSAMSPAELCNAIAAGDERLLKSVKGIGPKAAQRIILELKDKIVQSGITDKLDVASDNNQSAVAVNQEVRNEAISALTMLGFSPAPTAKVVNEILRQSPDMAVEQVVKQALKMIK